MRLRNIVLLALTSGVLFSLVGLFLTRSVVERLGGVNVVIVAEMPFHQEMLDIEQLKTRLVSPYLIPVGLAVQVDRHVVEVHLRRTTGDHGQRLDFSVMHLDIHARIHPDVSVSARWSSIM